MTNSCLFRLITITGAPGVGKTAVGQLLFDHCPPRSAWIDMDDLIQIRPWQVGQDYFALAGASIRACIANCKAWGARCLIVSGVIAARVYEQVASVLLRLGPQSKVYALWATPETIRDRVLRDTTCADLKRRLDELEYLNQAVRRIPNAVLMDTTALSIEEVVQHICELEQLDAEHWVSPAPQVDRHALQQQTAVGKRNELSQPARLIVITGAPGAGKTTIGRMVFERCPIRAAWVDADSLVRIRPWQVDADFLDLISANLQACIANYATWGARWIVVSGVIVADGVYDRLAHLLSNMEFGTSVYALRADSEILQQRIMRDAKSYTAQRLREVSLNETVCEIPDCAVIDTTTMHPSEVVERICELEGICR